MRLSVYRQRWWISTVLVSLGFGVSLLVGESAWATAPVLCATMIHLYDFEQRYISSSNQTTEVLTQLNDVKEALHEAEERIARDQAVIAAIGAVLESAARHAGTASSEPIRAMAPKALIALLTGPYTELVRDVSRFSDRNSNDLTLDGRRLAEQATAELVEKLPPGSVWCGITRVATRAWQGEALQSYLQRSRTKVKNGKLKMFRLYVVNKEDEHNSDLTRQVEDDREAGIVAKYASSKDDAPDITLAWRPARQKRERTEHERLVDGDDVAFDVLDDVEYYLPVGLLENDVRCGSVVRLTARTADSAEFMAYFGEFRRYWKNARNSL